MVGNVSFGPVWFSFLGQSLHLIAVVDERSGFKKNECRKLASVERGVKTDGALLLRTINSGSFFVRARENYKESVEAALSGLFNPGKSSLKEIKQKLISPSREAYFSE